VRAALAERRKLGQLARVEQRLEDVPGAAVETDDDGPGHLARVLRL
jgi:hypothetical protein